MQRNTLILPVISLHSPLALNPDLPNQIRSVGLTEGTSKGLSNFTHLLVSDSVKPFEQIRANFDIFNKGVYKYLHIRHFSGSLVKTDRICTSLLELGKILIQTISQRTDLQDLHLATLFWLFGLWLPEVVVGAWAGGDIYSCGLGRELQWNSSKMYLTIDTWTELYIFSGNLS